MIKSEWFSLNHANQIKELIEKSALNNIITYAQKTFPAECCGFILANGTIHPAHNIIASLYNPSLTNKNAFLIDQESWQAVNTCKSPIIGIYHSHTNGDPNMSGADMAYLKWPDLYYIIIGISDFNPIAAKLFWWESSHINELELKI